MLQRVAQGIIFVRQNPSILFSLFLLVFIPSALYIHTTLVVQSFEKNIDLTLQEEALSVGKLIGLIAAERFFDKEQLQKQISLVSRQNPGIRDLLLFTPQSPTSFLVIASVNPEAIGTESSETALTLAWGKNQSIAYASSQGKERFWNVVVPFGQDQNLGLVSLSLSLQTADALVVQSTRNSYIILVGLIVIILLLIAQHTRLFHYVFLARRLKEIDSMKDQFMRMAIHELQAPMANIRSYLYTIREELVKNSTIQELQEPKQHIDRAVLSVERLILLIQDMLQVSRIQRGALDFTPAKIDPRKVIEQIIEELRQKAEAKSITLEFLAPPRQEAYTISVHANRFAEILVNLIENAIKYTKQGSVKVKMSPDTSKNLCYIEVEDTGIGISAEEQQRLFEKFYRVRNEDTADIPGTGLGLWIAKTLAEKMGGKIYVESVKGVSTRFTLVFPF